MGAEPINKETQNSKPGPKPMMLVLSMLILFVSVVLALRVLFSSEEDAPKLSPKDNARLAKKLREIDDAEQYALIARYDGLYPCLHSGFQLYHLNTGNVWKYGVTTKGEKGRYSPQFLLKNDVIYQVQFKGNIAECLKQEQIRLFLYPLLPENLSRPPERRLPRPPYNSIMR